jgi:hypothetical protein
MPETETIVKNSLNECERIWAIGFDVALREPRTMWGAGIYIPDRAGFGDHIWPHGMSWDTLVQRLEACGGTAEWEENGVFVHWP